MAKLPNRTKIVYLSFQTLMDFLTGAIRETPVVLVGLPPDTSVISVNADFARSSWAIKLYSDQFDVVEDTEYAPEVETEDLYSNAGGARTLRAIKLVEAEQSHE